MEKILSSYLRRLTNLSGNNRSILLSRLIAGQSIDLHAFDFALNEPSFGIIEQLIAGKKKIPLCPVVDSRSESTNKLSKQLRQLSKVDKFIYEERGGKDLYVGWPFARGKFSDNTLVRCPVLFFPVSLSQEKDNWNLVLRKDVNVTLNKSFLLAYSFYNEIKLDEELLERVFDDFDKESQQFRKQLYELFEEHKLEINFNRENFEDKLIRYQDLNRIQLEKEERAGEVKFYPEAVLGIFPQAGSYLVPDYLKLIDENKLSSIQELFSSKYLREAKDDTSVVSSPYSFLNQVREEQTFTPFKMDAFQENALKAVKKGNSLVVQGPPGTGKSQLICNLISDYIARGKNVLMVCQKRAALDVVYERLKMKQVTDFVGLVHDFKNDRKATYQQLSKQISDLEDFKSKNNTIDSIYLEREFYRASRNIDRLNEEMEEFKSALFDERECGKSVKELYLTSDPLADTINVKQEYMHLDFTQYEEFKSALRRYLALASKYETEGHLFAYRPSYAKHGIAEFGLIKESIQGVKKVARIIKDRSTKILGFPIDFEDASWFLDRQDEIKKLVDMLKNDTVYQFFQYMVTYDQKIDPLSFSNAERNLMQCFTGYGPEISLVSDELGKFQEVLERSLDARKSLIKWINWKLFSKDKIFVSRVLIANNLESNREGFKILAEKIDNRLNLEHNLSKLAEKEWLSSIPKNYRKIDFQNWFYYQKLAISAHNSFVSFRNLKEYFNVKSLSFNELKNKITGILNGLSEVKKYRKKWKPYISNNTINVLVSDPEKEKLYVETLTRDFDSLCEYDALKDVFDPYKKVIVNKLIEKVSPMDLDKAFEVLDNSLRLAWIDHIETKYPTLRTVSSGKLFEQEEELRHTVSEKVRLSNEILLLKTRERTYKDLEFNRLNNRVTYRDLEHQVNKKRRIWPIRKLLSHFDREIFDLIPCWLVSPESASAIFPMEEIFDLVIFDEASQCFTENGIPSIYRGKQVVVTGDDKQLQPNDLYRVRWEEEESDDTAELEIDSLLDLAKINLMQVSLQGHYRSQSLDLIDFSNQHFYEGKLKLLPSYEAAARKEPAINYVKIDGIWENQMNMMEAEKVVELVLAEIKKNPFKEVGVVTFNVLQRALISELLEVKAAQQKIMLPESLIVKNIENIQGDEKDCIFFSIGYAPDKKGKMRLNFGTLNQEGGENRLNVAVTRAREKVVLVASILPAQLNVKDLKNQGPKLFKKYLEYAWQVANGEYLPSINQPKIWTSQWYLSHKLKELNILPNGQIEKKEEMPYADLTVYKQGKLHGLLLTDDYYYYDSLSIKDAHVYQPNAFRKKGWTFERLFSRQLWMNKEDVEDRLLRFYSQNRT